MSAEELEKKATSKDSKYFEHGIYVKKINVTQVVDISNNPKNPRKQGVYSFPSGWSPEQCLEVHYEYMKDGEVKKSKQILMSNYQYEDAKAKKGFKGWKIKGNPIFYFLKTSLGEFQINTDTWDVPDVSKIKDVELFQLSYCSGEGTGQYVGFPQFQTHNFFMPVVEGNDSVLAKMFTDNSKWLIENGKFKPEWYQVYKKNKIANENPDSEPEEEVSTVTNDLPF
jgi:hypothetical protein